MQARYTVTTACLARGTMTLTPSLARLLDLVPPVALAGGEAFPLEVDREAREVRGLHALYRALRVAPNDTLLLTPGERGVVVEVRPRPEGKREPPRQEGAKTPFPPSSFPSP